MSGPASGKYVIIIPVPEQLIEASANNRDRCAVKPVITNGEMRVWTVENVGEKYYRLILEDNWYSSKNDGKVVVETSVDPGTRWEIVRVKDTDDLYTIKSTLTDTDRVWTATRDAVVLVPLVYSPDQLWRFIPILED